MCEHVVRSSDIINHEDAKKRNHEIKKRTTETPAVAEAITGQAEYTENNIWTRVLLRRTHGLHG
jgi:hypothetical protein